MVVEVDGREVVDVLQFEKYLLKKEVGDRLKLVVERDGRRRNLSLQLDKVPVPSAGELAWSKLGIDVQGLTPEIAEHLGLSWLNGGVLITDVDESGPAAEIGLRADYVITSLGNYNITGVEQLAVLLERVKSGNVVDVGLAWSDDYGANEGYISIRAR
jgi:serine protease Do